MGFMHSKADAANAKSNESDRACKEEKKDINDETSKTQSDTGNAKSDKKEADTKQKQSDEIAEKLTKVTADLATAKEQNVRLLADFDNFRRRVTKERAETYQRASESIISEFLPLFDNFERAMGQAPADGDPFADGIRLVFEQLKNLFSKVGLERLDAVGTAFNPENHEAIAYQPSTDAPEGTIIYQAKCGFKMSGKVIRPASVIVSSGNHENDAAKEDTKTPQNADSEKKPQCDKAEDK